MHLTTSKSISIAADLNSTPRPIRRSFDPELQDIASRCFTRRNERCKWASRWRRHWILLHHCHLSARAQSRPISIEIIL